MAEEDFEEEEEFEEAECPTCGAVVSSDAMECPECGQLFDEEEELWDEDEEEFEEPWEEEIEEEPGKGKLYLGIFLALFGGVGLTFMSWFHNVIGIFHDAGIGGYEGYGYIDQSVGVTGTIVTIIGIVLIYLYFKDLRESGESSESIDEEEEEEFFEDAEPIDAEVMDEEEDAIFDEEDDYDEDW